MVTFPECRARQGATFRNAAVINVKISYNAKILY